MKISKEGIDLLKKFEGFEPKQYLCIAKKPTIGYGHVVNSTEYFNGKLLANCSLEEIDATELLKKDLFNFENGLNTVLKSLELKQNQFDAIICLIFNIGLEAFKNSTMLKLLLECDFEKSSKEFLKWCKITDAKTGEKVINKGLEKRRKKEKELFDKI